MKLLLNVFFCSLLVFLGGCATYHLTPQSLVDQAAESHPERKTLVYIALPLFYAGSVTGNDLRTLDCLDENGQLQTIIVTPHTGIRITRKDGTRKTFYFDTLLLKDSTITGSVTHFGNIQIKPIKLREIAKIEIQK